MSWPLILVLIVDFVVCLCWIVLLDLDGLVLTCRWVGSCSFDFCWLVLCCLGLFDCCLLRVVGCLLFDCFVNFIGVCLRLYWFWLALF